MGKLAPDCCHFHKSMKTIIKGIKEEVTKKGARPQKEVTLHATSQSSPCTPGSRQYVGLDKVADECGKQSRKVYTFNEDEVISILIIDVVQDTPIIKTSFVDFDAIRPPRFIFKSDYNFTIITCLENHIKINATQSTHVDYKSDITHPDETYGPSQLYLGFYQPSPGVFFYEYNEPDEMIDLIIMVLVVNDDNYTPDQPVQAITAFDSGGVGLIGGAWGLAAAARTRHDHGSCTIILLRIFSTQKNLQLTLSTIPFFNTINPDIKNRPSKQALSLAEQNDLILTRIDSFELFLQENVIHVHYLNGIRDKLAKPRATSTSTTDAMNTTQQQEGLMVTVPPQSSITNISDANDILYDDNNIRQ
ncbi:8467_t:CDS:2 [Rhizophagus irregularis]|nr:8467_t:CDS:2 [Rhizophagus irregularis]